MFSTSAVQRQGARFVIFDLSLVSRNRLYLGDPLDIKFPQPNYSHRFLDSLDSTPMPLLRNDANLMPYVVPEAIDQIFELRIGEELRSRSDTTRSVEDISRSLRRGIEGEIREDAATNAATAVVEQTPPEQWTRADFDLVAGDIRTDDSAWRDCLRLNRTLIRTAKEAWRVDQFAPGSAFTGFTLMLNSVYAANNKSSRRRKPGWNLLSFLATSGLEKRLVDTCRDVLGINVPQARRYLDAHDLLCRLAARHQLISSAEAEQTKKELSRLSKELE